MDSHSHDSEQCEHTHSTCDYVSDQKLNEYLVNDDIIYDATQIFDALSDFTRFQILGALVNGEKSVTELQEMLRYLSQQPLTSCVFCATAVLSMQKEMAEKLFTHLQMSTSQR